MKVVQENTLVEVGKFYNVRCAKRRSIYSDRVVYHPIIGIAHADPQFDGSGWRKHYHIDGRFSNLFGLETGRTNSFIAVDPKEEVNGYKFEGLVVKRRKCHRLETGIVLDYAPKQWLDWEKLYIGKSCRGKRCPHFGTVMHEREGGKLECPLHGLMANAETEIIINRFA